MFLDFIKELPDTFLKKIGLSNLTTTQKRGFFGFLVLLLLLPLGVFIAQLPTIFRSFANEARDGSIGIYLVPDYTDSENEIVEGGTITTPIVKLILRLPEKNQASLINSINLASITMVTPVRAQEETRYEEINRDAPITIDSSDYQKQSSQSDSHLFTDTSSNQVGLGECCGTGSGYSSCRSPYTCQPNPNYTACANLGGGVCIENQGGGSSGGANQGGGSSSGGSGGSSGGSSAPPAPVNLGRGQSCNLTSECNQSEGLVCANNKCIKVNGFSNIGDECYNVLECSNNEHECKVDSQSRKTTCQPRAENQRLGRGRFCGNNESGCSASLSCESTRTGSDVLKVCSEKQTVRRGQYCQNDTECQGYSPDNSTDKCENNICIAASLPSGGANNANVFNTKYIYVTNNPEGSFNNPNEYFKYTLTNDIDYHQGGFHIPYWAISPGEGSKKITVKFESDTGQLKIVHKQINYQIPKLGDAEVDNDFQRSFNFMNNSLAKFGRRLNISSNGSIWVSEVGSLNLKPIKEYEEKELQVLTYLLAKDLKINPYFALCPYFNESPQDRVKLYTIISNYGNSAPTLMASWQANQQLPSSLPAPYLFITRPDGRAIETGTGPLPLACDFLTGDTYQLFPELRSRINQQSDLRLRRSAVEQFMKDKFIGQEFVYPVDEEEKRIYEKKLTGLLELEKIVRSDVSSTRPQIKVEERTDFVISVLPPMMKVAAELSGVRDFASAWKMHEEGAPVDQIMSDWGAILALNVVGAIAVPERAPDAAFKTGKFLNNLSKGREVGIVVNTANGRKMLTAREFATAVEEGRLTQVLDRSKPIDWKVVYDEDIKNWIEISHSDIVARNKLPVRRVTDTEEDKYFLDHLLDKTDENGKIVHGDLSDNAAFVLNLEKIGAKDSLLILGAETKKLIRSWTDIPLEDRERLIREVDGVINDTLTSNRIIVKSKYWFMVDYEYYNAAAFNADSFIIMNSEVFNRVLDDPDYIDDVVHTIVHEVLHKIQRRMIYKGIKKAVNAGAASELSLENIDTYARFFTALIEKQTERNAVKLGLLDTPERYKKLDEIRSAMEELKISLMFEAGDKGGREALEGRYNELVRADTRFGLDLNIERLVTAYVGKFDLKEFFELLRTKGKLNLPDQNLQLIIGEVGSMERAEFTSKIGGIGLKVGVPSLLVTQYDLIHSQLEGKEVPPGQAVLFVDPIIQN